MILRLLHSVLAKHGGEVKAALVVVCLIMGVIVSTNAMAQAWGRPLETILFRYLPAIPASLLVWAVLATAAYAAYAIVVVFREREGSYDLCGKIVARKSPSRAGMGGLEGASPLAEPDYELAAFFMTACLTPQEVFTRIDERVKTYTRSLRVESRFTIRVPNRFGGLTPVIPIVLHPRGDYPESLELASANPGVDYLNIQETEAYVVKVLEILLPEVFLSDADQGLRTDALSFLSFVDAVDSKVVKQRKTTYDELMDRVSTVVGNGESAKRRLVMARAFMSMMIDSFPVCVMLPMRSSEERSDGESANRSSLAAFATSYSTMELVLTRRIPLVAIGASGPNYGRFRRFFARCVKRPSTFFYGLGNADRTQSYHLQTVGPEKTFCSLVKLKNRDAKAAGNAAGNAAPAADLALAQNRLGQRHFWLCVQNGSGFCHWWLMFRYAPRRMDAYHLSLVVMAVEAIALWSYAYVEFFSPGLSTSSAATSFISVLLGVMSIVAVWVSKTNNFGRGGDLGAQVAAIIAVLVAIVAIVGVNASHGPDDYAWPFAVVVIIAVLASCCLLLSARALAWVWVVSSFRRCDQSSVNLISDDSNAMACGDDGANISPGWLAVDANRFIAERDDGAIREELDTLYRDDRGCVRNAMLAQRR